MTKASASTDAATLDVRNQPIGQNKPVKAVAAPTEADMDVDHLARIREIAMQLPASSPEGATTASQKILFHLEAHADPQAYKSRVMEDRRRADQEEQRRAKRREAIKKPVPEEEKQASKAAAEELQAA